MAGDMKSDHYYAEMLGMMREQGKKDNPTTLQLGVMQSEKSVKINDLLLTAEDLYIADDLLEGFTLKVEIRPESHHSETDAEIVYKEGLKAGDLVAVQKLQDSDMYVILNRVVEA